MCFLGFTSTKMWDCGVGLNDILSSHPAPLPSLCYTTLIPNNKEEKRWILRRHSEITLNFADTGRNWMWRRWKRTGSTCGRWRECTRQNLEKYVTHLHKQFGKKTVKRKIASMKAFFSYLEEEEQIERNPFEKIKVRLPAAAISLWTGGAGPCPSSL